ncbi:MAG: LCP family protein [Dermatophilaceae bacterium]
MRTRAATGSFLVLALVVTLAGACSDDPAGSGAGPTSAAAAPSSDTATPTPAATPPVVVRGGDAALTALLTKVYAGRSGVVATATVGTWKREKVAVVTAGDDVTLAVGPRWQLAGGWWPSLGKPEQLPAGPRFVLAVGSDARFDQKLKGTRGDTLQVLGVDGKGGGGVLGIARDLWAPMPGGGRAKINAAYAQAGGPGQLQSVRSVTGLPIQGYVAVGFKGFIQLVGYSGGVPMTVPRTITQGAVTVKAGRNTLDSREALAYARERKSLPDGDFGRSRHQGDIIVAGAAAARLAGPRIIATTLSLLSPNADTDLSATEALTFAAQFMRADPKAIGRHVAKGGFGTAGGQSIVILGPESKAAFRAFRDGRL